MQNAKLQFKIQNLKKKYPKFLYKRYSYRISDNNLEIFFYFQIEPNIHFKPKVIIENVNEFQIKRIGERVLDNLVFNLGLMEIPSYWKATCSPEIEIKAGSLNKEQIKYPSVVKGGDERKFIDWWKDLIINGMGQFFYENKIDFQKPNFLRITSEKINLQRSVLCQANRGPSSVKLKNRVLVPVGGGKDSVVTLEILSSYAKASEDKEKIRCFSLNPTEAAEKIMKMAGFNNSIIVKRTIDPKLLELNRRGFLNGHTPFSAYLAFLSVLLAAIFDFKYIALSNERSSNEGNVKYLGKIINHQWSKSFEFEKKFREYSQKYLTSGVEYFSFLRPLYEIQIAKLFSKYPKYFSAFLSCNEAYKTASGTKKPTKKWCGNCSKCLFVFATLYPFTDEKNLIKIFGKNLFENENLLPVMQELMGERAFKLFECVGTKKESLIAFYLSFKKYRGSTPANLPLLLEYFQKKILLKYPNLEKESKTIMNSWNSQNNLPKEGEFEKVLKKIVFKK